MKDYSMNFEERKDFILGYDITEEGQIIIKFAHGKPWVVPYNQENEQKLLNKMKSQIANAQEKEAILNKKIKRSDALFAFLFISNIVSICALAITTTIAPLSLCVVASLCGVADIIPLAFSIKNSLKLSDLRKNVDFLKMEDKLNENARKIEQNVLVNVSNKTKDVIENTPKDKEVFNINSFNYVPFRDLEQIMENVERNQKFGFDYTPVQKPKTRVKTKDE